MPVLHEHLFVGSFTLIHSFLFSFRHSILILKCEYCEYLIFFFYYIYILHFVLLVYFITDTWQDWSSSADLSWQWSKSWSVWYIMDLQSFCCYQSSFSWWRSDRMFLWWLVFFILLHYYMVYLCVFINLFPNIHIHRLVVHIVGLGT